MGQNRNDEKRILAATIAYNISKYSLNSIKKYHKILALSFVGTHDLNKECSSFGTKTMDECGGKQMCLIKNMDITIEIIIKTFNDQTYQRKQTAISSIAGLCQLCQNDLDYNLLKQLIHQILQSLPGKIWDGKMKLFDALNNIPTHCQQLIDHDLKQQIIKSLLIEIQRKKIREYRIAAINAFGEIILK